ncbi:hypothetical protein AB670_00648 [Chryseobacterium sp. MOF25P]|nr:MULTISPECIES: hypothetical protein [unclassified Chryseobacterium]OBW42964.1 hypothetical protein AB670_00648 [Chryseobacterium sp. MOF25P]OBW46929.1 hypothetical protein AB671_00939 [Chryseobacterium sp. BGARF1]
MADFNLDDEIKLRLKCLLLAKSDIKKASDMFIWLKTGNLPVNDRI